MRLFLLTALTMAAFAANSVLNRAALTGGGITAQDFGTLRLLSGAFMLAGLCVLLRGKVALRGPGRLVGVAGLLTYIFGFSYGYQSLDAGLGALILFGTVQVTMFTGSLLQGERPPPMRWIGAALAFGGLAWLLAPGTTPSVSVIHSGAMALAGMGWGLYSLAGRRAQDPLVATAANFILAAPVALLAGVAAGLLTGLPDHGLPSANAQGLVLAVASGAVTSGLGYALWYAVLPRLQGSVAAVAQLTVPVIAMAGGMTVLDEPLTLTFAIGALIVLGGVGLSLMPQRAKASIGS